MRIGLYPGTFDPVTLGHIDIIQRANDIAATSELDELLKQMLAKNTVLMDETGPVRRYAPAVAKEDMAREETNSLLRRMFAGKASLLVSNLVETGELSQDDLRELLDVMERGGKTL